MPRPGFEGKSFYVWFDAPISYLALTSEWCQAVPERGDWQEWWRPGPGARHVEFLGKDNVAFHAVFFPAVLIGSGEEIRLVDRIKALNWLTWGDEKFSTSAGRGIFTDRALEVLPADFWRWWLCANAPENGDTRFTLALFVEGCNTFLADTLGNLVNRAFRFSSTRFGALIPVGGEPGPDEDALTSAAQSILADITADFDSARLRRACDGIRALWSLGNAYITEQAPWTVIRIDPERAACITRTALNLIGLAASVSEPVIPSAAAAILAGLGRSPRTAWPETAADWLGQHGGAPLSVVPPLFPKIDADGALALEDAFAARC